MTSCPSEHCALSFVRQFNRKLGKLCHDRVTVKSNDTYLIVQSWYAMCILCCCLMFTYFMNVNSHNILNNSHWTTRTFWFWRY